jgi:pilus assembly protein CpaC
MVAVLSFGSCTASLNRPPGPPRATLPGLEERKAAAAGATSAVTPGTNLAEPSAAMRSIIDEVAADPAIEDPGRAPARTKSATSYVVQAGKSRLIEFERPVRRVSLGNPEIADIVLVTPQSLLLNGLRAGDTSLILWDADGVSQVHTISVEESSDRQVLLEITIAELNRTAMEEHGVDFRVLRTDLGLILQPAKVAPLTGLFPPTPPDPLFQKTLGDNVTFGILDPKRDIAAFVEFIQREGLGKVLARPRLVARSGHEGKFLSGGEIPIIIAEALQTSVTFKEFGTRLRFKPTVLADDTIDLEVNPEVSEPDFANGVSLFGFQVPAFVTRRADTRVRLQDGESLVIAGLFRDTRAESTEKIPYLGDVPGLGYLFRKTSYDRIKSELMIVVRPRLAEPTPAGVAIAVPDRESLRPEEVRTQRTDAPVARPRITLPLPTDEPSHDGNLSTSGDPAVKGWSIQVSVTPDAEAAQALMARLLDRGEQAYVVPFRRYRADPLYHVRIGRYPTMEDAIRAAQRLRTLPDIQDAVVVSD